MCSSKEIITYKGVIIHLDLQLIPSLIRLRTSKYKRCKKSLINYRFHFAMKITWLKKVSSISKRRKNKGKILLRRKYQNVHSSQRPIIKVRSWATTLKDLSSYTERPQITMTNWKWGRTKRLKKWILRSQNKNALSNLLCLRLESFKSLKIRAIMGINQLISLLKEVMLRISRRNS